VTFAYLGHASVLIDFQGTMLLTDPTLYPRIGLSLGPLTIGPKREVVSALAAEEIPKLDAVLVTHAHMDSLDRPSLARLSTTPLLIIPERCRDLGSDLGYAEVVELPWGKTVTTGGVTIEAVEVAQELVKIGALGSEIWNMWVMNWEIRSARSRSRVIRRSCTVCMTAKATSRSAKTATPATPTRWRRTYFFRR
jgi:hypothetical protein